MADQLWVATRKGLFKFEKTGIKWTITERAFLGDPVTMFLPDPRDGHCYAAVGHGHFGAKMHRRAPNGEWTEIAAPEYPERPADAEPERDLLRNIEIPWSLEMIWALESAGPDRDGVLWCGTLPGGLFISHDRGDSWKMVRTLWDLPERREWSGGGYDYPGIHSICVDPRDSNTVTLGVSVGGVWQTTDFGETWACRASGMYAEYMPPERREEPNIQDPHRVTQCPGEPDVFWSQHHNDVFRSTDNCKSWHDITAVKPAKFGFAVAVHPRNGDTAWLVPAIKDEQRIPVDGQVVVAYTRDGGQSFDVQRNGLPQDDAYDLVFRHALEVDSSGQRLAMGSTTGAALWVTEDAGKKWDLQTAHLPPIYAVRFAQS